MSAAAGGPAGDALARALARELGAPVSIVLTRNRTRLVAARRAGDGWLVRVHAALAELAPPDVALLARFLRGERAARPALRDLVRARRAALQGVDRPNRPDRPARAQPVAAAPPPGGRHHDLADVVASVRARFFPDLPPVAAAWSGTVGRARRHVRLGSWCEARRLVRVHRRLDASDVPRFFVESVVHHELCHAVLGGAPARPGGARRRVHGPDFRRLERSFPDHVRAAAWERAHVQALLRPPRAR
jgi:hypothetical protein